ncbi:hypothetical protein [Streptomyces cavernicola]|uniref:Lipoprotein n=1 Tax=Streptomyces cavernicola TaxID=3043613 RepID=A0ABT6SA28_9ACTN|nr:hypothetical protein [Streptomyces sp. B-S-A6]MDI3404542.1 hypothetical protein [Streptomyces sp. B-S-A6]
MFRSRRERRRPGLAGRARVVLLPVLGLLAGCSDAGGLESAGPTERAVGPARLWPQLPPAQAESPDAGEATVEVVEGVAVPDRDLHKVDPLAVVKAELAAQPRTDTGSEAIPADTAAAVERCPASKKPDQAVPGCPVLQAYYRDLTGSGKDELIVGIRYSQGALGIRVYSLDAGRLIRIMSTAEEVTRVELAGRDVIVHEPAQSPDYEFRYAWSWDARQHAMLPARIEIVRTDRHGSPEPEQSGSPSPSASLSPSPSASPSAGRS